MSAPTLLGSDEAMPLIALHPVGPALIEAGYMLARDEDEQVVWVEVADRERYMLGGMASDGAHLTLWDMETASIVTAGAFRAVFDAYQVVWAAG